MNKTPTQVQERPMNFSEMKHKNYTDAVSDSILQLIFKELQFVEF
jgi:hypothetical protein